MPRKLAATTAPLDQAERGELRLLLGTFSSSGEGPCLTSGMFSTFNLEVGKLFFFFENGKFMKNMWKSLKGERRTLPKGGYVDLKKHGKHLDSVSFEIGKR